jgi:replicative DNA helicase
MLLDHSTYEKVGDHGAIIKLLAAKNRHGSRGEVPLMWDYTTLKAREVDEREFEEGAR